MKAILKGAEPPLLAAYRASHPNNTWKQFRRNDDRKKQVQTELKHNQGGICAYCEINLIDSDSTGKADFRVEHFHPKSDVITAKNWHLDWQNLLGCCHGGSQSDVADSVTRFTSPDYSCDVPKDNKDLDDIILNPLHIPCFPPLFNCERTSGLLKVNHEYCQAANVSPVKAQNTLDELCLVAPRLNRLRKAHLDSLNREMSKLLSKKVAIGEARNHLARVFLSKDALGHWPKFFSSTRSYLGAEAERHLQNINFVG